MQLAELIQRAAAGDGEARDRLIADFYPEVKRMVHRQLDADFRHRHRWMLPLFSTGDVVQDVFCGVLGAIGDFRPDDEGAFLRYLTTLVKHRLIDAVRYYEAGRRDGRRQVEFGTAGAPEPEVDATPSAVAAVAEQLAAYRSVLEALPLRERTLLELRLGDGERFEAVAEKLGYPSADAARKACNRAQAHLLVRLQRLGISASPATQSSALESNGGKGP
jgi:RNA polymerase sigma factor (sigma-70 family)